MHCLRGMLLGDRASTPANTATFDKGIQPYRHIVTVMRTIHYNEFSSPPKTMVIDCVLQFVRNETWVRSNSIPRHLKCSAMRRVRSSHTSSHNFGGNGRPSGRASIYCSPSECCRRLGAGTQSCHTRHKYPTLARSRRRVARKFAPLICRTVMINSTDSEPKGSTYLIFSPNKIIRLHPSEPELFQMVLPDSN